MSEKHLTPESIPLAGSHQSTIRGPNAFVKRVTDILGALIGIPLCAPLMIVTAILIKLDSRGPVLLDLKILLSTIPAVIQGDGSY